MNMFGEQFPRLNIPKSEGSEHGDEWYEQQVEILFQGIPTELSTRLQNEIDEAELDPKAAHEKVSDFVRKRNNISLRTSIKIVNPEMVHSELHEDLDERILECVDREVADIRSSLEDPENYIGQGLVAKVFESGTWPKVCYKVVHDMEAYRAGNPVYKEIDFLGRLNDLSVEGVRTPHAYFDVQEMGLVVIGMERLQAFSIDDVVLRRPDMLAEMKNRGFDVEKFFKKLEAYLVEMHKLGVYHLDLFARNIMIDWETLDPRVIDFGRSEHFDFESDVPDRIESDDFEKMKVAKKELKAALRR